LQNITNFRLLGDFITLTRSLPDLCPAGPHRPDALMNVPFSNSGAAPQIAVKRWERTFCMVLQMLDLDLLYVK